ncbi:MAG: hypothetical protein VW268_14885 [Rhodospirillaceae bacterium]
MDAASDPLMWQATPLPRGLVPGAMADHFGSPAREAAACRTSAALFDYSFLIRLVVRGPDAVAGVSRFCARDFSDLKIGDIRYALHADAEGMLLSDLTVWRTGTDELEVMSGRTEDPPTLHRLFTGKNAHVADLSSETACFAVQGPATDGILAELPGGEAFSDIPYFKFRQLRLNGVPCCIGRLGFTGLPGVEILCPLQRAAELWRALARLAPPAGLIAADRIRLEAGLPLFTQDFRPPVTAAEAGLARVRPLSANPNHPALLRVVRVTFRARLHNPKADKVDVDGIIWNDGDPFPPLPGTVAVTSVARDPDGESVIGMGYINRSDYAQAVRDAKGILGPVEITRHIDGGGRRP